MLSVNDELVIDPHDGGSIGLPVPEVSKLSYVLVTHDHYDHNAFYRIASNEVRVGFEGQVTLGRYKIRGVKLNHDRVNGRRRGKTSVYEVSYDGVTLLHMGDIGEFPKESFLKTLRADVLALPVGGLTTVSGEEAAELVKILKPNAVIPLHYWVKGLLLPLDPPDEFLKSINYEQAKRKEINENNSKKQVFLL